MAKKDPLQKYRAMRDFSKTSEPSTGGEAGSDASAFVIQKHWATRLHYDFRLELDGTLKSWAVPKGPSLDPTDKRMAVHVEDHPLSYQDFEGTIPAKQYGAGKVIVWDSGVWKPEGDAARGYRDGKLKFTLHGKKLQGGWTLVRMKGKSEQKEPWLLIKEKDAFARASDTYSVVDEMPDSVAQPPQQRQAPPSSLKPQLATLVEAVPPDPTQWLFEAKFDGYRLLTHVTAHGARLFTRSGLDWTHRLKPLAQSMSSLPEGWYDGEIVVLNEQGVPDFQLLQGSFDRSSPDAIVYYLFDMPYSEGQDLRSEPLTARRARLESALASTVELQDDSRIRFSAAFDVPAADLLISACKLGLEGLIGKRKDSRYVSGRSPSWIKLKCGQRQEFVIVGYTEPQGARVGIGALLLGFHDEKGQLRYAGKVGTGFGSASLASLRKQLDAIRAQECPLSSTAGTEKGALWVKPVLLAEVSFAQWTNSGRIRHAVFQGLRSDKPAQDITRETSMKAKPPSNHDIKVSSPDRLVDKTTRTRKIDIVDYYAEVAPLLLEHLKERPVSLLRAPEGVKGSMFFQKHLGPTKMAGVRELSRDLDPDHDPLMEIASAKGLISAAQMNVIEFHTWNARKSLIGKPDRMTFDLDPGKGVEWPAIKEAAFILRTFLTELELPCFIKTSGGQGLHVVVPLQRRHDWTTVKDFSKDVVTHLAKILPRHFSARSGPRNRVGKIFIDYLRNGFGATTVSAWSARARPGMGVSVPLSWDEVEQLEGPQHWRLENIRERMAEGNAPWSDYSAAATTLTEATRILRRAGPSRAPKDAD